MIMNCEALKKSWNGQYNFNKQIRIGKGVVRKFWKRTSWKYSRRSSQIGFDCLFQKRIPKKYNNLQSPVVQ